MSLCQFSKYFELFLEFALILIIDKKLGRFELLMVGNGFDN